MVSKNRQNKSINRQYHQYDIFEARNRQNDDNSSNLAAMDVILPHTLAANGRSKQYKFSMLSHVHFVLFKFKNKNCISKDPMN